MYNIMKSILDEGVRLSQLFNVTTTRTPTPPRDSDPIDKGTQSQGYDINTAKSLAYERLSDGEQPKYSHDMCNNLTCGYDGPDDFGEFQFPLDVDAEYVIGQNNGDHLPKEESFL